MEKENFCKELDEKNYLCLVFNIPNKNFECCTYFQPFEDGKCAYFIKGQCFCAPARAEAAVKKEEGLIQLEDE